MVRPNLQLSIEEGFQRLARSEAERLPSRPEFRDPLLASLQKGSLSQAIDRQLDAFYNPSGPVDLISRVFRRFRRA